MVFHGGEQGHIHLLLARNKADGDKFRIVKATPPKARGNWVGAVPFTELSRPLTPANYAEFLPFQQNQCRRVTYIFTIPTMGLPSDIFHLPTFFQQDQCRVGRSRYLRELSILQRSDSPLTAILQERRREPAGGSHFAVGACLWGGSARATAKWGNEAGLHQRNCW